MAEDEVKQESLEIKLRDTGATFKEAEAALTTRKAAFEKRLEVDLGEEVARMVGVLLYKGDKPSIKGAHLGGSGATYDEAMAIVKTDFGIDPSQFNQTVEIRATYRLEGEEAEKVAEAAAKIPTAGPVRSQGRTDYKFM